jgi:hypothetical protein
VVDHLERLAEAGAAAATARPVLTETDVTAEIEADVATGA